jgi:hypothetical protein
MNVYYYIAKVVIKHQSINLLPYISPLSQGIGLKYIFPIYTFL